MERGSRTRLVTALILTAVFGSGLMIGLAADGSLLAEPPTEVPAADTDSERDGERSRRTYTYEQVDPTEAQMALIDSIVREHRARNKALHEEFQAAYNPRYQALIAEAREAIKAVFTPEQAAEYQRLLDERDRRRAERAANEKKDQN